MRIIWVWIIALTLLTTVTVGWYITLPIGLGLSSSIESQVPVGLPTMIFRIVEFVVIVWGPVWDIFIALWAYMESQRVDVTSQTFG